MCASFFVELSKQELADVYGVEAVDHLDPRELYPYRPTKSGAPAKDYNLVPTILADGTHRSLTRMRWGLLPPWAKSDQEPIQPFNAQAEGVATKPMFKTAFRSRRCLVPATAFYEFRATAAGKVRYAFRLPEPFAFAGIWNEFDGLSTMAFITVPASAWFSTTHHRQPVMLTGNAMDQWLKEPAENLLLPFDGPMIEDAKPKA